MPAPRHLLLDLFARALPDWVDAGDALTDALDLEGPSGAAYPAAFRLAPVHPGPASDVAFEAELLSAVEPADRRRADVVLAARERAAGPSTGAVRLAASGRLRYVAVRAPEGGAWTVMSAGAFATDALADAEASLVEAYGALAATEVRFAPVAAPPEGATPGVPVEGVRLGSGDLTEIVCVLDRSGSMESVRADAVGGFNAFLAAQQALPGAARLTLVLFDHAYDVVLDGVPVAEVPPLTDATYVPRGSTALLDAVGQTLQTVHGRIAGLPEAGRPGAVLVCILTDGQENTSQEYTRDAVRALVERRQGDGWEFQFLAAGPDAFAEGGGMGIAVADSVQFSADAAGTAFAFASVSERAASARRR